MEALGCLSKQPIKERFYSSIEEEIGLPKFKLEYFSSFKKWIKGDGSFEISLNNYTKTFHFQDFRDIRKQNKLEYPGDPDVNTKRQWGFRTNGAEKGNPKHTCLDCTLSLGHLEFNYTNWEYNKKYRN